MIEEKLSTRMQYYSFLNRRNKKIRFRDIIKFPEIKEEEELLDYYKRCKKEVGAKPSPIGPLKRVKPNSKCHCGSGKKSKKCCHEGE